MNYREEPKPEEIYQPEPNFKDIAEFLWNLLDDIDTLEDACKDSDREFRVSANHIQQRRYEVGNTDGYEIQWKTDTQNITASYPGSIFIDEKLKRTHSTPIPDQRIISSYEDGLFGGTDGESDPRRRE